MSTDTERVMIYCTLSLFWLACVHDFFLSGKLCSLTHYKQGNEIMPAIPVIPSWFILLYWYYNRC